MIEYPKIQTLFKRNLTAPGKPMIEGDWTTEDLRYLKDNEWELTEKVDGTNIRIEYRQSPKDAIKVRFGGRTDNAQMPVKLMAYLQETFTPEIFDNQGMPDMILFGEGYGPGIQNGGLYTTFQQFVLFDVYVDGWWLKPDAVDDIANKLNIKAVPIIGWGNLEQAISIVKNGMKSNWGDFEAEGIVARPVVQLFNRKGERIITKIKGRDFK